MASQIRFDIGSETKIHQRNCIRLCAFETEALTSSGLWKRYRPSYLSKLRTQTAAFDIVFCIQVPLFGASFAILENLTKTSSRELAICAGLSPLVKINVHRPYSKRFICIGASEFAGAVVYSSAEESELETLLDAWLRYRETHLKMQKLNYLELVRSFGKQRTWKTAFSHSWTKEEDINGLENHTF